MEDMIAYCGLKCSNCDAYIATKNDDDELRKEVAERWFGEYVADIKPENIFCDGCLDKEGKHISHWGECEIRTCNENRGTENCAHCDYYICDKLNEYINVSEEMKNNLNNIRESITR